MNNNYEFLLSDISKLKNVGKKTSVIFKKKKVNTIFDLLWRLPQNYTDRSNIFKIKDLHIGKISTLEIVPLKYNFPRIRNLPNKVICEDETGKLDCIFFNSYEGYIRKILPLNEKITISGKVGFFKNRYQITNPTYVSKDKNIIKKIHNKYSLTEGITEKKYSSIINQILDNLPDLDEWHHPNITKLFSNLKWKESIVKLHDFKNIGEQNSKFYKRLAFDEILSSFLVFSEIRKLIKKVKKNKKIFTNKYTDKTIKNFGFKLTIDQKKALDEINLDLFSKSKMFRMLQGDVGSGKTIVALLSSLNVIESGYQVAFMAPTEILANQHFQLAKKLFPSEIKINLLTSKTDNFNKKKIISDLNKSQIQMIFGTHALFQKKTVFKKLGYIIIDEQHKFGVKQRKSLSDKGGSNCDILLMSATPIPRTLTMAIYGDMDLSIIKEKPKNRKEVITYSKSEEKINDVISFVKKEIKDNNQIFWVCPLIEESKKRLRKKQE